MNTYPNSDPVTPTGPLPVVRLLLCPLLLVGTFVALSYPLYALAAAVALIAARRLLTTLLAGEYGRVRKLSLPGVGTVRFTVEPR